MAIATELSKHVA